MVSKSKERKKRWFKPRTHSGWRKDMPPVVRRKMELNSRGGDLLSAARAKQALANVTKDPETKKAASSDAEFFRKAYRDLKTVKKRNSKKLKRIM